MAIDVGMGINISMGINTDNNLGIGIAITLQHNKYVPVSFVVKQA